MSIRNAIPVDSKSVEMRVEPRRNCWGIFSGRRKARIIFAGLEDRKNLYVHFEMVKNQNERFGDSAPKVPLFKRGRYLPVRINSKGTALWILVNKRSLSRLGISSKSLKNHKKDPEGLISDQVQWLIRNLSPSQKK